jgi:hypothetical protein
VKLYKHKGSATNAAPISAQRNRKAGHSTTPRCSTTNRTTAPLLLEISCVQATEYQDVQKLAHHDTRTANNHRLRPPRYCISSHSGLLIKSTLTNSRPTAILERLPRLYSLACYYPRRRCPSCKCSRRYLPTNIMLTVFHRFPSGPLYLSAHTFWLNLAMESSLSTMSPKRMRSW